MSVDREGQTGPVPAPLVMVIRRRSGGEDGRMWQLTCSCGRLDVSVDTGEIGVAAAEHWEREHAEGP